MQIKNEVIPFEVLKNHNLEICGVHKYQIMKVNFIINKTNRGQLSTSRFPLQGSAVGVIFMPPPKNLAFPMQRAVTSGNISHSPSLTYRMARAK